MDEGGGYEVAKGQRRGSKRSNMPSVNSERRE
jgi:hypothetical protein